MQKKCISKDWMLKGPLDLEYKPVDLPNDYAITMPRDEYAAGGANNGYYQSGIGTYVKKFSIGEEKKHYILDIDGAYMCTNVKVNRKEAGMHPHGYTPILIDITDKLNPAQENTIVITTNALQCSTRWYSGAGIYRDVFMWESGDIRIEPWDLFITTPTLRKVNAAYEISSDRAAEVVLRARIKSADGLTVATSEKQITLNPDTKTPINISFEIDGLTPWDVENPYLYTLCSDIIENGCKIETDCRKFGVRTATADAENGLLFNGKPMKLRGGCIHHDHGVLGAADFPAACRRKLTKLKNAGFNAIRTAHNPPSLQLLEICDEIGLIVMDEVFDAWRKHKCGAFNYNRYFDEWWKRDIEYMVKRDRNHPCVLSYSTGNEIPESNGSDEGNELSPLLANEIRKYDDTRLVTSATFQNTDYEIWAERTRTYFAPYDICGYNYMYYRYETDHELFPKRVIWGSETHALNFYNSWNAVLANNHVIGDFTWTAYDNMGEVGTGRSLWARDGVIKGISTADWPWRTCYQGDFDLCGYRRPQSYFREAVFIGNTEPRIFTTHPEHYGEDFTGTGWHWYDVYDSWTFDDRYIGKPVKCEVYTDADEIKWILNGRELGISKPVKAIATLDVNYEKGELSVIAYKDGRECGRSALHTVGEPAAVKIEPETNGLAADNRDLCYLDIFVTDSNGDRIPYAENELTCYVEGGELMGIFSGNPCNLDCYGSNKCHAFDGRAVAVVRAKTTGNLTVTVQSDGLTSAAVNLKKY